jgi:hypothetical protein
LKVHFHEENVALVRLRFNETVWDWCDLNAYTKEGVQELLQLHYINQTMIDNGLKWMVLGSTKCTTDDFSSVFYSYVATTGPTSYPILASPFLQGMGCIGQLTVGTTLFSVIPYVTPRGVDRSTGEVLPSLFWFSKEKHKELKEKLVGTHVTMFGGAVTANDVIVLLDEYYSFLANGQTFIIRHIQDDDDTVNGGYVDPQYPFYYYHRTTIVFSCSFCLVCMMHNLVVMRSFIRSEKYKTGFNYSFLTLVFAMLGNMARFVVFLDPLSLTGTLNIEGYWACVSISDSFHVFSSLSSLLVWVDTVFAVQESLKMKFRGFSFLKLLHIRIAFFLSITVLGLIDVYVTLVR